MASEVTHGPSGATAGRTYGRTGWIGWIYFAAVMMLIVGAMNAFHGIVAIVNDEWVVWTNEGDLYVDLTTWGWVHLGVGIAVFLAGLGLFTGNPMARVVAVVVASVSILANFLYIPAYPLWTLTIIAIDVFVIYAVVAHGGELR